MNLYTIGFTKRSAKEFFGLLTKNEVKRLIDIRLNNKSQLTGFTKGEDLEYFLRVIGNIEYFHMPDYAPTKELLKGYQNKSISWNEYEKKYIDILKQRNILQNIDFSFFENACLLCSEPAAEHCHRRLLAEYLAKHNKEIKISHI